MKTIGEIQQNTPEWHEWRKEGIGASEANIIMGVSKFCTPLELWEKKVYGERSEKDDKGNFITQKGHRLEEISRPVFELEKFAEFPAVTAIHSSLPWLRASLDGYCEELNEVWECKFVGQDDFEKVKNGDYLEQYYPQIQHQLLVTGARINNLFVIADDKERKGEKFPYKTACIEIEPDPEYIQNELFPKLCEFWNKVKKKEKPDLTEKDTIDMSGDKKLMAMLEEYKYKQKVVNDVKEEFDKIKTKIFKYIKHNRVVCDGVKITNSTSLDSVKPDYEAYIKAHKIKVPAEYMKVSKGRNTKKITFPKQ